jgi:raffinose/stachyose/melibiose transport system substrate-binding protein
MSYERLYRLPRLAAAVSVLAAVGLAGSFTAHAAQPRHVAHADKTVITIWDEFTDQGSSKAADQLYANYMAQHPNIEIKRQAFTTDQMRQAVKTGLASGTGPDIVYYDAGPGYAGVLASAGLLASLKPYTKKYNWSKRIARLARQGTTINGQFYGIPLETDLVGMYYNATLIKQAGLTAPQTFSQLESFCRKASAKGYIPVDFADKDGWPAFHQFSMVTNDMLGPKGLAQLLFQHKGHWNTPQITNGIQSYFVNLQKAGCFPRSPDGVSYADSNALFYAGKALLYPTGSWLAGGIVDTIKDKYQIKMMPLPTPPGAKGRYWVSGVGSAYFISSKSAHAAEDAQILNYLITPAAARIWSSVAQFYLPVSFSTKGLNEPPLLRSIASVLGSAGKGKIALGYNIDVMAPPKFNLAMQNGFQAILAGQLTAKQEAAKLEAAWKNGG